MSSLASLSVCAARYNRWEIFFSSFDSTSLQKLIFDVCIYYGGLSTIMWFSSQCVERTAWNPNRWTFFPTQRLSKLKLTCFSSFKIDCWLIFVDTPPPQPTPFDFWWLFAVRYSISDFTSFSNWSSVFQSSSAWLLLTDDVRLRCRPALLDFLRLPVFDATATGCDGGIVSLQLLSPVSFTSIALSLPFAWLVLSNSSRISFWARRTGGSGECVIEAVNHVKREKIKKIRKISLQVSCYISLH